MTQPGPILPRLGRFIVYRKALELAALVYAIPVTGDLRAQLHRAIESVVLNLAEGGGDSTSANRKRYFQYSRDSLSEASSACDLVLVRGIDIDEDDLRRRVRELDAMLRSLLR